MTETDNTDTGRVLTAGAGRWITQSFPTNFHQFWKTRPLLPTEREEDFQEVTDAQRKVLEKSDAAWTRPEQWIIDQYRQRCNFIAGSGARVAVGDYNEDTGYFEFGELTRDLTTASAVQFVTMTPVSAPNTGSQATNFTTGMSGRVACVRSGGVGGQNMAAQFNYCGCGAIAPVGYYGNCQPTDSSQMFYACRSLREVVGVMEMKGCRRADSMFGLCGSLEMVWLKDLAVSISFADSPRLRMECLEYLVENAKGENEITVTLHPDLYATLPESLVSAAADKLITFATT